MLLSLLSNQAAPTKIQHLKWAGVWYAIAVWENDAGVWKQGVFSKKESGTWK